MKMIAVQMVDDTVPDEWWKALLRHFLREGDELEIRCWKEEMEAVKAASKYGKPAAEKKEVSVRGEATGAFLRELMGEEPAERSGCHAMTRYFTINVRNERALFSAQHYGTELYMELSREEDAAFVEGVFRPWGEAFSVWIKDA